MKGRHDYRQLDALLAARIRLAAVTLLATVDSASFSYLRDQLGASDGNLGAHMQKLAAAGYVREIKRFVDRKPNTSYRLTATGRRALNEYLGHLQSMLGPEGQSR